jgi:CubicO group peptidase (beta-lactamase class C family)
MLLRKSMAIAVLIAVAVCALTAVRGDSPQKPSPATDLRSQDVDRLFAPWDKRDSPGCVVGVIQDGKLIYERAFGMANLDLDCAICKESVFTIASLSKQFTAACILLLSQDGVLSLEDDIRKHVPEMPQYGRPITIRHLLNHTSGIRDYGNELLPLLGIRGVALSDEEVMDLLARQKGLNFLPGDAFRYSNSGYRLLGIIVKRVTGKSLREYADERIFRPVGMKHTHFQDDAGQIVKHRVAGYTLTADGKLVARADIGVCVGDSGVMSTVEDFFLWDQCLCQERLGKPGFLNQFLTPGKLSDGSSVPYAQGLNLGEYRGLKTLWHTGSAYGGFRSMYLRFPQQQFSVVIFANSTGPKGLNAYRLAHQVADLYLADSLRQEPEPKSRSTATSVPISKQDLERKQGTFLDPNGAPWILTANADGLLVTMGLFSPSIYKTEPLSPMRFRSTDKSFSFEIEFHGAEKDSSPSVHVYPLGGKPYPLERVQLVSPTSDELKRLAGPYFSDELQTIYSIENEKGKLILKTPKEPGSPLKATVRDTFKARRSGGNLTITFVRGPDQDVCGFDLAQSGGVKDMHFTKR